MKKVLASILSVAMLSGMFTLPVSASAAKQDYTYEAKELYNIGMLKGTDKGLELDKTLTRAEAVTILIRAMGLESKAMEYSECGFSDVSADSYAVPYIALAKELEITNGVSKTEFAPDALITGNQSAVLVARAAGFDNYYLKHDNGLSFLADRGTISETDAAGMEIFTRGDMAKIIYEMREEGYFISEQYPVLITEKENSEGEVWKYIMYTNADGIDVLDVSTADTKITYQMNSCSVNATDSCIYYVKTGAPHDFGSLNNEIIKLNFSDMAPGYEGEKVIALNEIDEKHKLYSVTVDDSVIFDGNYIYYLSVLPAGHFYSAFCALNYMKGKGYISSSAVWDTYSDLCLLSSDVNTAKLRLYVSNRGYYSHITIDKTTNIFK